MFLGCQLEVRAGFRAGSSLALFAAGKVRVLTRDRSGTCILCYTALYWGSPHLWQRCPRDSAPPPRCRETAADTRTIPDPLYPDSRPTLTLVPTPAVVHTQ